MDGFPATGLPPSRPNARAPRLPARYSDAADEEAPTQQPNRKRARAPVWDSVGGEWSLDEIGALLSALDAQIRSSRHPAEEAIAGQGAADGGAGEEGGHGGGARSAGPVIDVAALAASVPGRSEAQVQAVWAVVMGMVAAGGGHLLAADMTPKTVYDALSAALLQQQAQQMLPPPASRSTSRDTTGVAPAGAGHPPPSPPPAGGDTAGAGAAGAHPGTASRCGRPPLAPGSATRSSRRPRQLYGDATGAAGGNNPLAGSGASFDALLALAEVGAKATTAAGGGGALSQRQPHQQLLSVGATPKSERKHHHAVVPVHNAHSKRSLRRRRKPAVEQLTPGMQALSMHLQGQSPGGTHIAFGAVATPASNRRAPAVTPSLRTSSPGSGRARGGAAASGHLTPPPSPPRGGGAGVIASWLSFCGSDAATLIPGEGLGAQGGDGDEMQSDAILRLASFLQRSSRARRWALCEWFTPFIDDVPPSAAAPTQVPQSPGATGKGSRSEGRSQGSQQNRVSHPAGTFAAWLAHCGLGGISRLRRCEWRAVRAALGKPRRVSLAFLREQRDAMEGDRARARAAYTRLKHAGRLGASLQYAQAVRDELLPLGVPLPLAVGERVLAVHPRTRCVHPGNVLTVDMARCRVQFDRLELGTEFVGDTMVARAPPPSAAGAAAAATMAAPMPTSAAKRPPPPGMSSGLTFPPGSGDRGSTRKRGAAALTASDVSPDGGGRMPASKQQQRQSHGTPTGVTPSSPAATASRFAAARALYGSQAPEAVAAVTAVAAAAAAAARGAFPGSPREAAAATAVALATASHEKDAACLAELSAALDRKEEVLTQLRVIHTEAAVSPGAAAEALPVALLRAHHQLLAALREVNVRVDAALAALRARERFHEGLTPGENGAMAAADDGDAADIAAAVGAALVQSAHALHGRSAGAGQWRPGGALPMDGTWPSHMAGGGHASASLAHRLLAAATADAAQLVASCQTDMGHATAARFIVDELDGDATPPSTAEGEVVAAPAALAPESVPLVRDCVALLLLVRSIADAPDAMHGARMISMLDAALNALRPRHGENEELFSKVASVVADVKEQLSTVYAT